MLMMCLRKPIKVYSLYSHTNYLGLPSISLLGVGKNIFDGEEGEKKEKERCDDDVIEASHNGMNFLLIGFLHYL